MSFEKACDGSGNAAPTPPSQCSGILSVEPTLGSYRTPGITHLKPEEQSPLSSSGHQSETNSHLVCPHEDIQQYIPLIDRLLSTADLGQVSPGKIRQELEKVVNKDLISHETELNNLIKLRIQQIEAAHIGDSHSVSSSLSIVQSSREPDSHQPNNSLQREKGINEVVADNNIPNDDSSNVIDLTQTDNNEKCKQSPSQERDTSSGQKRKRDSSDLDQNARSKSEKDFNSRLSTHRMTRSQMSELIERLQSGRTVLKLEEVMLKIGNTQCVYHWDRETEAWKGTEGLFKVAGLFSSNLDFLIHAKVRHESHTKSAYLYPKRVKRGLNVFQGLDENRCPLEVTIGEMRDMLCNPEGRLFAGHILNFD